MQKNLHFKIQTCSNFPLFEFNSFENCKQPAKKSPENTISKQNVNIPTEKTKKNNWKT